MENTKLLITAFNNASSERESIKNEICKLVKSLETCKDDEIDKIVLGIIRLFKKREEIIVYRILEVALYYVNFRMSVLKYVKEHDPNGIIESFCYKNHNDKESIFKHFCDRLESRINDENKAGSIRSNSHQLRKQSFTSLLSSARMDIFGTSYDKIQSDSDADSE